MPAHTPPLSEHDPGTIVSELVFTKIGRTSLGGSWTLVGRSDNWARRVQRVGGVHGSQAGIRAQFNTWFGSTHFLAIWFGLAPGRVGSLGLGWAIFVTSKKKII